MHTYAIWRSRPVFVTSTFRDMQAEQSAPRLPEKRRSGGVPCPRTRA
jgi:hypothetical protein